MPPLRGLTRKLIPPGSPGSNSPIPTVTSPHVHLLRAQRRWSKPARNALPRLPLPGSLPPATGRLPTCGEMGRGATSRALQRLPISFKHGARSFSRLLRRPRSSPLRAGRSSHRFASSSAPKLGSPEPPPTLSQRLRKLSREYGWVALGVYLGLSALDFPFCFLAVRLLGTDRIGRWEHRAIEAFWGVFAAAFPAVAATRERAAVDGRAPAGGPAEPVEQAEQAAAGWSGGLEEAEKRSRRQDASIWTQLALAYAVHKSFIFVRVPLTAAVTPKVVRVLRGWGYEIGKRRPKVPKPSTKD